MRQFSKIVFPISIVLFMGSIALGLFGRAFCTRSNDNYKEIQPESFVPDTIETVLQDEELKQIYVCYNDANCVNVYTEDGNFLWCVATPYMRNSYFELQDGKLIICDGNAYIYDSQNGSFLGIENEENLDLDYNWEKEYDDQFTEGNFYFDSFQVYRVSADGTLDVITSRPWWHRIFDYSLSLAIAFCGAVGIGLSIFLEKLRDFIAAKKIAVFKDQKEKAAKLYFKITTIVHMIYTILNIFSAVVGTGVLILGIIPLTLHMIVSNIVLANRKPHQSLHNSDEMRVIDFWGAAEIGSYIIAFLSCVITIEIVG